MINKTIINKGHIKKNLNSYPDTPRPPVPKSHLHTKSVAKESKMPEEMLDFNQPFENDELENLTQLLVTFHLPLNEVTPMALFFARQSVWFNVDGRQRALNFIESWKKS